MFIPKLNTRDGVESRKLSGMNIKDWFCSTFSFPWCEERTPIYYEIVEQWRLRQPAVFATMH